MRKSLIPVIFLVILTSLQSFGQEGDKAWEVLLRAGNKLYDQKQYVQAIEEYKKAASEAEKSSGTNSYEYAFVQYYIGLVYSNTGSYSESVPYLEKAAAGFAKSKGKESKLYQGALFSLAGAQSKIFDLPNAEKNYLEALSLARKIFGPNSGEEGQVLLELEDFYYNSGQTDKMKNAQGKVQEYYKKSIFANESSKGANDKDVNALYFNYGSWLRKIGQHKEAGDAFAKSAAITKILEGEKSYSFFNVSWYAGLSYYLSKELSLSLKYYEPAIAPAKELFETGKVDRESYLWFIEDASKPYQDLGKADPAMMLLNEAIALREKTETLKNNKSYSDDLSRSIDLSVMLGKAELADGYYLKKLKATDPDSAGYSVVIARWTSFLSKNQLSGSFEKVEKEGLSYLQYKESKNQKDLNYADVLNTLSRIAMKRKDYQKAIKGLKESQAIVEKKAGKETFFYIQVSSSIVEAQTLGKLYTSETDKAVEEIMALSTKVFLPAYPDDYSESVELAAEYYLTANKMDAAEAVLLEGVKKLQPGHGWDDKNVIVLSAALRGVVKKTGHTDKISFMPAEMSEQQGQVVVNELGLQEGMQDADMIGKYVEKGQYPQAVALFEKNYSVISAYFINKKDYTTLIQMQSVMAKYYKEIGELKQAEDLLFKSYDLAKQFLGEKNQVYIVSLTSIGEFYETTGSDGRAQQYYDKAIRLVNAADLDQKGKDELYYLILFKIGNLYSRNGFYEDADKYLNQAGDYYYEVSGKESLDYAYVLSSLARLYMRESLYYDSERLYRMALPTVEKLKGKDGLDYAELSSGLASALQLMGNYTEAEPLYIRALEITAGTLGKKSQRYIALLGDLAMLYTDMGKFDKAAPIFTELNSSMIYKVRNFFPALSEREKTGFYNTMRPRIDMYNAFVIKSGSRYSGDMYDLQLTTKGLLFRSTKKVREAILSSNDSTSIRLYKQWQAKKNTMVRIYQMSAEEKKVANIDQAKLEQEINDLEKLLTSRSELFGKSVAASSSTVTWRDIQKSLKSGEAAVEMVRLIDAAPVYTFEYIGKGLQYDSVGPQKPCKITGIVSDRTSAHKAGLIPGDQILEINGIATTGKSMSQLEEMFAAPVTNLLVLKFAGGQKIKVALKPDSVFTRTIEKMPRYAALIISPGLAAPELVVLANGTELEGKYAKYYQNMIKLKGKDELSYLQYWDKIAQHLKGISKVYFSADGVYNSINLNTLYNSASGKYLVDEMNIRLLANTAEIIGLGHGKIALNNMSAALIGFPDYYSQGSGTTTANAPEKNRTDFTALRSDTTQRFMSGNKVSELPGTKTEIEKIEATLTANKVKVMKHVSASASEDNLKKLNSPSILHIATHGFFLTQTSASESNERGITGVSNALMNENPLLRSGLLFAGAGNTISGTSVNSSEDGILTAYEAMNLSLDKTQLIVLSACETGLGEIRNGEGVYGLQRSFKAAGAKTILMSLWKVNDQATQQLMTEFYSNLAATGDKYESFRKAQVKLKETFPDPYYWGAFIMVGE
ncbi:MAG: CHAT domain-containing protein [Cytophagaceae bacterium]